MIMMAAFIIGDIFLNLGRSLKPFNPDDKESSKLIMMKKIKIETNLNIVNISKNKNLKWLIFVSLKNFCNQNDNKFKPNFNSSQTFIVLIKININSVFVIFITH